MIITITHIFVYFMMEQKQFKQPNIRREAMGPEISSSQELLHISSEGEAMFKWISVYFDYILRHDH